MARTPEQLANAIRRESDAKIDRLVRTLLRQESIEDIADVRLTAWARWVNGGVKDGPADPACTLGKVKEERVAAGQRGAPAEPPSGVDQVERIVCTLEPGDRHIIDVYYCDYSPMNQKAKDCGLSRSGFHRALKRVQRRVYMELY